MRCLQNRFCESKKTDVLIDKKGKSINVVTACATGTNSIGEAFRTIQYGDADVMLAGGTEGSVTPIGIAGFTALTAPCRRSITCLPMRA